MKIKHITPITLYLDFNAQRVWTSVAVYVPEQNQRFENGLKVTLELHCHLSFSKHFQLV